MDKPIPKKRWSTRKLATIGGGLLLAALLIYLVSVSGGNSRLRVDADRISIAQVERGAFEEYVPINGSVQPHTTVYLDLEEGGIVEKIYAQGGVPVEKGDLILSFTNATAQKSHIDSESQLLRALNELRTQKINLTQSHLSSQERLLDLNKNILDAERRFNQLQQLKKNNSPSVTQDEFETARDDLNYLKEKRVLLQERIHQEGILREQQEQSIDESIERTDRSLAILSRIMDSLEVRAPISGHLSSISAEVGQSFTRGQRIGQIDQLDSFKVNAAIDQYYISKVKIGQRGSFEFDGQTYELEISKIYPEVINDSFSVDMEFVSDLANGIKRGQTLQIDLSLSESNTTNIVSKGGLYRYTNGRWAYKISEDGKSAHRVPIVAGRQNPQMFEVLEGLNVGDWIITSGYDTYNDVDELIFSEPVTNSLATR